MIRALILTAAIVAVIYFVAPAAFHHFVDNTLEAFDFLRHGHPGEMFRFIGQKLLPNAR